MATATFTTPFSHEDDTGFRTWVAEFISLLDTGGALVRTADTGQIDGGTTGGTITAVRPAINTNAGYVVYRFNDTLQATAPYFFRIDFGTAGSSNIPRVLLTVGTGSNGAGTITGNFVNSQHIVSGVSTTSLASTTTPYTSYACGHPGSLNLCFKVYSLGNSVGFLYLGIHRIRNSIGEQTSDGLVLIATPLVSLSSQTTSMLTHRRINPTTFGSIANSSSANFCLVPMLTTNSIAPGSAALCYRHFAALPEQRPVLESVTVINSEVTLGSTFTARPVGNTDRTYIALGSVCRRVVAGTSSPDSTYGIAMLYD